ncbi:serine/threonine protein kinase [Actinomadura oligospora]|uniref:serine/threonine protein kinase n=1 Tax=Actinomadura oligospora TaxID=111804 RepID=UPI0004B45BE0|nr:protein kinase [Actinomadura oligospora]
MDPVAIGEPLGPWDPRTLGSYDIRRRLGRGGQGVVYLAESAEHGLVAIKLLGGEAPGAVSEDVARRFAREADAAMAVAEFCTARVLTVGTDQGRPFLVSEYVPGPSLQALVVERGPRTGSDLDRIAVATATALVAIHQAGIVHRDFKPANVIMGPDGPRVIDFGIARASGPEAAQTTAVVGTPAYMAPEQLSSTSPTSAVDVFAWAATLVFVATGRPPFGADAMTTHRILHEQPALDGVPERLLPLVTDCLAKDPSGRPSAEQLLLRLLTGRASGTVPPQPTASQMLGMGADLAASPLQSGDQNARTDAGRQSPASAQGFPGVPALPAFPGAAPDAPGFPGVPADGPGFPGVPSDSPGFPGVPADSPGFPGVPAGSGASPSLASGHPAAAHSPATQPPGHVAAHGMGAAGPPSSPHTVPGSPPPPRRRVGPMVGVAAGVAAGLLVAGTAAYALWPDDKPSAPVAAVGTPTPSTPPTSKASTKPSSAPAKAEKSGSPTRSPSKSSSPGKSASPPGKKPPKTTGGWSAPSAAAGISASGNWDTRSGQFVGTLVLRMTASKGWAVFEHQHSDGGPMCDYGVEFAKPGQTHTSSFGSKCTGMFRVRTCLASNVDTSGTYPQISYSRCTAWRPIFQ